MIYLKRVLALFIALALFAGVPAALADEPLTDAMTRVTLAAVEALDIPDTYDEFSGDLYEGRWSLNWSGEAGFARALVDADGQVMNYYRYDNREIYDRGGFSASFPKYGPEELKKTADAFLSRVITRPGWSWTLKDIQPSLIRSAYDAARVNGTLLLGGVETDISFTLAIDPSSLQVNSFYRSDAYAEYTQSEDAGTEYFGRKGESFFHADASCGGADGMQPKALRDWAGLGMRPCPVCVADEAAKAAAQKTLLAALGMEAVYYVTDEKDMARLVYVRTDRTPLAVRLSDGKLVDWTKDEVVFTAEAAMDEDAGLAEMKVSGRSLTETEKSGIQLYEGAVPTAELDARLRAMPELGLKDTDVLERADYSVNDKKPCAYLVYRRDLNDGEVWRNFTLDALTGRITTLYSYSSEYARTGGKPDTQTWQGTADAFINAYYGEYAGMLRLTSSDADAPLGSREATVSYTYTRQHEGFLFRGNSVTVRVDPADGSVCGFMLNWNDGQEFYSADKDALIGEEKAARLWNSPSGEPEPRLMYLSVPVKAEDGKVTYALTLCWQFVRDESVYAVDAVTGEAYGSKPDTDSRFTYPESAGMLYENEVRLLGGYGVGLSECGFTASDLCTPEALMHRVLQAGGIETGDRMEPDALRRLFRNLYGRLPEAQDGHISRGELARVMAEAAGYGQAAKLTGIYASSAADWDTVPEELKGSLAIAGALGLIGQTETGFDWQSPALAADAAHAVYALLSR